MSLRTGDGRVSAKLTKTTMMIRVNYGAHDYVDISLVDLLRDANMSTGEAYALADDVITRDSCHEKDVRSQLAARFQGKRRDHFVMENGTRCRYCRRKGDMRVGPNGKPWHIDHVIPVSAGGSNHPDNLALACSSCNTAKGNRP